MKWLGKWLPLLNFRGSGDYWEKRYRYGGDSGLGSEGRAAAYKAQVLNEFVRGQCVQSVIEFGCGDGRQLELLDYADYLGFDVSPAAVDMCEAKFCGDVTKRFALVDDYRGEKADLALSLDVLFHLVEDSIYFNYLDRLFMAADRFAIVYATSIEVPVKTLQHVRHRPVEHDIASRYPEFERMTGVEAALPPPVELGQGGYTRFFIYRRHPQR